MPITLTFSFLKEKNENVYECPLKMRANCKLELM